MSKYRITLDGKTYEMEVEKIDGNASGGCEKAAPKMKSEEKETVQSTGVPNSTSVRDNIVISPMPGTVLKILVTAGDTVKQGQTVLVLEAMKMENEITAPKAGRVEAIHVKQGDTVQGGAKLFEIGE